MKELENIFSNSETKKESICPNPKTPIIIDTREKNSLIAANLIEQKANIKFEKLEVGDYLVQNTCIERKTFTDFLSSMLNKRLPEQLINLKKYEKNFLIIEGFGYNYNKYNVNENAIRGMLLSIATTFQVPIIYTANEADTSKFLIQLAKKYEKNSSQEYSIRQNKTAKTRQEQKQFILEGFPEIGPVASKKMIKNFKNLKEIFNSLPEELKKLDLNESQIGKFYSMLND